MMPSEPPLPDIPAKTSSPRDWVLLGLSASLAGIAVGLVCSIFRLTLMEATNLREVLIDGLGDKSVVGFLLIVILAGAGASIAARMVRRIEPSAAGSGIPRVMAVLDGTVAPAPIRVVPVKFVAGTLAIGSGLALGREGPSVQMGASLAYWVGRMFQRGAADCQALLAAGAGAGFATAFNAPIAGAIFVAEALIKRFETRVVLCALAASASAISVGRVIVGEVPEFLVPAFNAPRLAEMPLYALLGLGAGLAGIAYNRSLLSASTFAEGLPIKGEVRAAAVGAAMGAIAWFAPSLVGSGDALAQQALNGDGTIALLLLLWGFRLILIVCSVCAGTPGGLLVPFLSLGAELGLCFGLIYGTLLPNAGIEPAAFALVGTAALFTAIIRAPITAIVLITEITTNAALLLPMVVACFVAMLVPTYMKEMPLLDALKARRMHRLPQKDGRNG